MGLNFLPKNELKEIAVHVIHDLFYVGHLFLADNNLMHLYLSIAISALHKAKDLRVAAGIPY